MSCDGGRILYESCDSMMRACTLTRTWTLTDRVNPTHANTNPASTLSPMYVHMSDISTYIGDSVEAPSVRRLRLRMKV